MLSDDTLNNLMQPMIDRQEAINIYVIRKIAKRIKEIGELTPSDVYQLEQLLKTGSDVQKINAELARLTALQVEDIKQFIKIVAKDSYLMAKPYYDYRHKPFIPFSQNTDLQRVVKAIERHTVGTYTNLSRAQAFMLRDLQNPQVLIPTPLATAYQSVVDEAVQAVQGGVIDYNTAMQRTLNQLVDSGLRGVTYQAESGKFHTQRLDTAVRRNLLDGVREINQGVQQITGEQFGADGVELSVHQMPATDHQFVQGHIFTNEEFDKMQNGHDCYDREGRLYKGFDRAIGTLNCRHFAWSLVVETAIPNYSDEQLQGILNANNRGYTLPNGKHLTLYECTQYQRKMETNIRKAKDGQIAAREAGNMKLAQKYQAKIDKYTKEYKEFSKACGISAKLQKTTVKGYKKL